MVEADVEAVRLAKQCCKWLPAAGYAPPGLFERAAFRLRMRGSLIAGPGYLLRLLLSPTEEDWHDSTAESGHRLFDVLRRPFRLARKYSRSLRD